MDGMVSVILLVNERQKPGTKGRPTMALIEREALLAEIRRYAHLYLTEDQQTALILAVSQIETAPAVDAAPVVHGRWIVKELSFGAFGVGQGCKCSACDKWAGADAFLMPYCPNCGALMDGGEDDG